MTQRGDASPILRNALFVDARTTPHGPSPINGTDAGGVAASIVACVVSAFEGWSMVAVGTLPCPADGLAASFRRVAAEISVGVSVEESAAAEIAEKLLDEGGDGSPAGDDLLPLLVDSDLLRASTKWRRWRRRPEVRRAREAVVFAERLRVHLQDSITKQLLHGVAFASAASVRRLAIDPDRVLIIFFSERDEVTAASIWGDRRWLRRLFIAVSAVAPAMKRDHVVQAYALVDQDSAHRISGCSIDRIGPLPLPRLRRPPTVRRRDAGSHSPKDGGDSVAKKVVIVTDDALLLDPREEATAARTLCLEPREDCAAVTIRISSSRGWVPIDGLRFTGPVRAL